MKALLLSLLLSLALALPGPAAAQDAHFRIKVLHAGLKGDKVDPKIPENIKKYLLKSFGAKYTAFTLLDSQELVVKPTKTGNVILPDKSALKLEFREVQGNFIKLTMEIKDLRTTIRIKEGGLFFQAGHKFKDGILVLAISASTKKGGPETIGPVRPDPRKTHPEQPDKPLRPIDSVPGKKDVESK